MITSGNPNLYATLGVTPDASTNELRHAYRALAKTLHPDISGHREKFVAVKRAFDILSNPERRAHYDRTGEVHEPGPDNAHVESLTRASEAIQSAIEIVSKVYNPLHHNILQIARDALNDRFQDVDKQITNLRKMRDIQLRAAACLQAPPGRDPITGFIRNKVEELDTIITKAEAEQTICHQALEILQGYTFTPESETPPTLIERPCLDAEKFLELQKGTSL